MKNNQQNLEKLIKQADRLLAQKKDRKLKSLLLKQDFHLIGKIINHLSRGKLKVFALLPPEIQAEVALSLNKNSKRLIFPRLGEYALARLLHFNDEDDAVDILQFLPQETHERILEKLKVEKQRKIKKLLKFAPETAGGLMDLNFILVKPDFTLKDVAEKVQRHIVKYKKAPLVVVVDKRGKIQGYIPYKNLILTSPETKIRRLIHSLPLISHKEDQEKILLKISRQESEVMGVVDEGRKILGIIHLQDLLRVVQMEATEDIYRFAGVDREEDVFDSPFLAVRRRYKWLIFNLGTAFLAALVVALFEGTVSRMAILAAYLPVVAGSGGNAGTQALAVVVRGLALGEVSWENARRIIFKEIITGFFNGLIIGLVAAGVAIIFQGDILLAVVLASALLINLLVAGFFGALVPLFLKALKIDPAIASSIFITTATDVFGFLTFLGLARLILF